MHKTDALGHVAGMFDPGDPMVPRRPTKLDHTWLNAVQEEIRGPIAAAGLTLRASGAADAAAGYASQLLEAIDILSPVRAACIVEYTGPDTVAIVGTARNVASVEVVPVSGAAPNTPKRIRVNFTAGAVVIPIAPSVDLVRRGLGTLPAAGDEVRVVIQEVASTHVDFFIQSDNPTLNVGNASHRYAVVMIGTGA